MAEGAREATRGIFVAVRFDTDGLGAAATTGIWVGKQQVIRGHA